MTISLKNAVAAIVLALSIAAPADAGPYADADAAERRNDYATAIPIFPALAAKGNAAAMTRLGFFYQIGVGVKRDWLEAAKWYSKALEAGDESAAIQLGGIGRQWRVMHQAPVNSVVYELIE